MNDRKTRHVCPTPRLQQEAREIQQSEPERMYESIVKEIPQYATTAGCEVLTNPYRRHLK
jgi:hypothetical protein